MKLEDDTFLQYEILDTFSAGGISKSKLTSWTFNYFLIKRTALHLGLNVMYIFTIGV